MKMIVNSIEMKPQIRNVHILWVNILLNKWTETEFNDQIVIDRSIKLCFVLHHSRF